MDDWSLMSGDQYQCDVESRYPIFSDMQLSDYQILTPEHTKSLENKYQYEQQGYPTYYNHAQKTCNREVPQRVYPMQRLSVSDRENLLRVDPGWPGVMQVPAAMNISQVDAPSLLLMFMFVVFVFVCWMYAGAMSELKSLHEKMVPAVVST
jgi:hypothetical protein